MVPITTVLFLDSVTRHPMLTTNVPQFRLLLLTDVDYHMTPGVKMAATGRIHWIGHVASQDNSLALAVDSRVRQGN